jgi:SRSO17 transposase
MIGEMVPTANWIVDDTGFPSQGKHSVGVASQYSGTWGKVGNCQFVVPFHLATAGHCVPVNFEIYLPKAWKDDPLRMKDAGVPGGYYFKPK